MVHWKARLFDIDEPQFSNVSCGALSVSLDWAFCSICVFCIFLVALMDTIHGPPNSAKRRFLGKFRLHNAIYIFKIYFATVFSANK